jgi:hypothetical protein
MSNFTVCECDCGHAANAQLGIQIATMIGSFLAAIFASERCRIKTRCCEMNLKPNNAPVTPGSAQDSPIEQV